MFMPLNDDHPKKCAQNLPTTDDFLSTNKLSENPIILGG